MTFLSADLLSYTPCLYSIPQHFISYAPCIREKYHSLLGGPSEHRERSNELVTFKQDSSCTRYF